MTLFHLHLPVSSKDFVFFFTEHICELNICAIAYFQTLAYGTRVKLPGFCASMMYLFIFRGQTAIPLAALAVSLQPRALLASITKFSHLLWKVSKQLFVS